ncbi:S-layer homology domain-containing protein [Paenibacillus rigui]|uniref:SLH domain-containing protein n=1 Tax=Paenibacillus rigui TaxID=554312 RepID=A0A229UMA6_9BACL|nr:S-layer homology domain-containing protein [Paenibacillus rigui]OXM84501.1 hypothetical protein CF651_20320 [Paenibacillus rigui]
MRFNQKTISLAGLVVFVFFSMTVWIGRAAADSWADHANIDWYNADYKTYTIDSADKVAGIAKLVNTGMTDFQGKVLEVNANVDLSAYNWVPIGNESRPFKGTIMGKQGQIYDLSGLRLDSSDKYAGFIGYMNGGTVGNLHLSGAIRINANTDVRVGSAVGYMDQSSIVYQLTNDASIDVVTSKDAFVGGIVGDGSGMISDAVNHANVTLNGSNRGVIGGIAAASGGTSGLTMKKIENTGAVSVSNSVYEANAGGVIGLASKPLSMGDEDTAIRNSGSVTAVNNKRTAAGGILGKAAGSVQLTFSKLTSNAGNLNITGAASTGSFVGGLVGLAEQNLQADMNFQQTGSILNMTGASVYTGGISGYVYGDLTWAQSFSNNVPITVAGSGDIYTGGLAGKAGGTVTFKNGAKNTAPMQVSATGDRIYSGGLIGFAGSRLVLDSSAKDAYGNSGELVITGGTEVYTGGIISNKAYAKTANNVVSTGNINVSGKQKLYTGGFVGSIAAGGSGEDIQLSKEAFGQTITVRAASSGEDSEVYTGGIVGYYAANGTIDSPVFTGHLSVQGGAGAFTGGVAGYVNGGTIAQAKIGNTKESQAELLSDGALGGAAGYVNGKIMAASVKDASLQAAGVNGFAGGIAGKAKGEIASSVIGNMDTTEGSSFTLTVKAAKVSAGGLIGADDGALLIQSSTVRGITLTSEAVANGLKLGGLAGTASANVTAGAQGAGVSVQDLTITTRGADSAAGGVVGDNRAMLSDGLLQAVSGITATSDGDNSRLGGIAGDHKGVLTGLSVKSLSLTANGANSRIGGMAGDAQGNIINPRVYTEDGSLLELTVQGINSAVGGIAGTTSNSTIQGNGSSGNVSGLVITAPASASGAKAGGIVGDSLKTSLKHVVAESPVITVRGAGTMAGGLVGRIQDASITESYVLGVLPDYAALTVAGNDAEAGGMAGRAERAVVSGNGADFNINNLTLATDSAANGVRAAALIGASIETDINSVFAQQVNVTAKGTSSVVGGIAGYNKGSETAVIRKSYMEGLTISVPQTASASVVGGLIGLNDARSGQADAASVLSAVSTIQNSRMAGKLVVHAPSAVTGGLIGDNRSFVANNSIADRLPVTADGNDSIVGGLIGSNAGTLYYTYSNAVLTIGGQATIAGGLVGDNTGKLLSSYIETDLVGHAAGTEQRYALLGGLAGRNSGSLDKSFTSAKVTAAGPYTYVGGLVGGHTGTITNSYAAKEVMASGQQSYSGGLIGLLTTGNVTGSYSAGQVTGGNDAYAGGFAGYYNNASKELIDNTYYVKDEQLGINSGLLDFGGGTYYELNMYSRLSPILSSSLADRNSFPGLSGWTFSDTAWRYGSLNADYKYPELNLTANAGDPSGGGSGGGEEDGGSNVNLNINWYTKKPTALRFVIQTEADLAGLAGIVNGTVPGVDRFNFLGREIELKAPIHMQSNQWTPIGNKEANAFEGTFIGNHLLISGLQVSAADYAGLFGVIGSSGTVQQLKLEPISINGQQYVGTLAGLSKGSVSDIEVTLNSQAKVTNGAFTGGILGKSTGRLVQLSLTVQDGKLTTPVHQAAIGGLVGENASSLNGGMLSLLKGSIEASGSNAVAGGIAGRQTGDIGAITAAIQTGGTVQATGEAAVAGGMIGSYVSGAADGLQLQLNGGTIQAPAAHSIAGGIVGQSAAGQRILHAKLNGTGAAPAEGPLAEGHIAASVAGGIVGDKTGSGNNSFEVDGAEVHHVLLSTSDGGFVGGIAGKLNRTAIRQAVFEGTITVAANDVKAGGITGFSLDSILYKPETAAKIALATATGESSVGGIAGIVKAADIDAALDFGLMIPLYSGVYEAKVHDNAIEVTGTGQLAQVYAGAITGQLQTASVYNSDSTGALTITGVKHAVAGGITGFSTGVIVHTKAETAIQADTSSNYTIGGIVGQATGGKLAYVQVFSTHQERIVVGSSMAQERIPTATRVGGAVGMADGVSMLHASSSMPIEVNSTNPYNTINAGGFAGLLGDSAPGVIRRAFAEGSVKVSGKAGAYAGGFAGLMNRYTVQEAYASGDVMNTSFDARGGGFAAIINNGSLIEDAYASQESVTVQGVNNATRAYAGGFAGYNDGSLNRVYARVTNISSQGAGSNSYRGALIGYNFRDGKVADAFYTGSLQPIQYDTSSAGQSVHVNKADFSGHAKLANWSFAANGSIWGYMDGVNHDAPVLAQVTNWNFAPDLSVLTQQTKGETTYTAMSAAQLAGIVQLYNGNAELFGLFDRTASQLPAIRKIILGADIDLSHRLWTPIADFQDEFDGGHYAISGLTSYADQYDKYGLISVNRGVVSHVKLQGANVTGGSFTGVVVGLNDAEALLSSIIVSDSRVQGNGDHTGGVTGSNAGRLEQIRIQKMSVAGTDRVGGVAGSSTGELKAVSTGDLTTVSATGSYAGGLAGVLSGVLTVYQTGEIQVLAPEGSYVGGIAGSAREAAVSIIEAGPITAQGKSYVGGITGESSQLKGAVLTKVTVTGHSYVGGAAGHSTGTIEAVTLRSLDLTGTEFVGGLSGSNEGLIDRSSVNGAIQAKGTVAGGIAGVNAGQIVLSFSKTQLQASNPAGAAAAGGIAGINGPSASIARSFSYSVVSADAATPYAGGLAGENHGAITASYNSGTVRASGTIEASAGGIAGYALEGTISNTWNAGPVESSMQGLMVKGKSFFGGIAGKLAQGAVLKNNVYDEQQLQLSIAYYNEAGSRVTSADGLVKASKTAALVKGSLPDGFDKSVWTAVSGYYPQLTEALGTTDSRLSTASIQLSEGNTLYRVTGPYQLTQDASLGWTSSSTGGQTILTASIAGESRTMILNRQALKYAETASKPTSQSPQTFNEKLDIVLSTTEAEGLIYYTLDGTTPTESSLLYTKPIAVSATTTLKAITVTDGKNPSEPYSGTFQKATPPGGGGGGGGGGIYIPQTGSQVEVVVNGKSELAGTETTTAQGTSTVTTIGLNEQAIGKLLEKQGERPEVAIVFSRASDIYRGELSGELVRQMQAVKASLVVDTGTASYRIPSEQLQLNAIAAQFGDKIALQNMMIRLEIRSADTEQRNQLAKAAAEVDFTVVGSPELFKVTSMYGEQTQDIAPFTAYVERSITLPEGVSTATMTTAVSLAGDGTISHVPTEMRSLNGKRVAVIHSLYSQGVYALINKPVEFKDAQAHWANPAIHEMGSRLIVSGTAPERFEPDRSITRGEFAAMVVKALGLQAASTQSAFQDVQLGDWYAPYVEAAQQYGVISGYGNGSFGPHDMLTREQAMTIIVRAMKLAGADPKLMQDETHPGLNDFKDAELIADYAEPAIQEALSTGLITGRDGGFIAPKDSMTRAETAVLLQRLLQLSKLI